MKTKIFIIIITAVLAISPLIGSGEYAYYNHPYAQENPVHVHADGFIISIQRDRPAVEFYSLNESAPVFKVDYLYVYAYSDDISNPEYRADLSIPSWTSSVYNSTEEDGTIRTLITMNASLTMKSATSSIAGWGNAVFEFLILVKGDEAQLGVSLKLKDITPISGVSHISLVQEIDGNHDLTMENSRISVSGVYYRWDPEASIKSAYGERKAEVSALLSNHTLYLTYPYDTEVREISHYSGRVDIGSYGVIRDMTSEILGYGLGILLGSILLGIPYASHRKNRKSPFDMDSPLYRK